MDLHTHQSRHNCRCQSQMFGYTISIVHTFAVLLGAVCILFSFPLSTSASVIPGARGKQQSIGVEEWSWNYIDATPSPLKGHSFPYRYGVGDRDQRDRNGERYVPAIRYAHSAVHTKEAMIITHGYHYDMSPNGGGATWLSDTWEFTFATHRWSRLHPHVEHPREGPVARYAAIAVLVGGDMYLHGGDDGGHAERLPSYKHAIYGDMWRFILTPHSTHSLYTWVRVKTAVASKPVGMSTHLPSVINPRYPLDELYRAQHGFALAPLGPNDLVWQLDRSLEAGIDEANRVETAAPYLFVSHGLYAAEKIPPNGQKKHKKKPKVVDLLSDEFDVIDADDLWVFSFRSKEWRQMKTSTPVPPGRFGHSLVYVPHIGVSQQQRASQLETNPSGSLFLYGGFSRTEGNRGDLWMISLQQNPSFPSLAPYTWLQLHESIGGGNGGGRSPGNRAYYNLFWTPDSKLHLFGGARCEPGCVCSAEYWLFDLQQLQGDKSTSDYKWDLLVNSPYSPSSLSYPQRLSSGHPEKPLYSTADESVQKGYPVHRYKQSMLRAPPASSSSSVKFEMYLFGGESYNPSAYFQDVWKFEYAPTSPAEPNSKHPPSTLSSDSIQLDAALSDLLNFRPFPAFERDLPTSRIIPPEPFHVHSPPNGWGYWSTPSTYPYDVWSWSEEILGPHDPLSRNAARGGRVGSRLQSSGEAVSSMMHQFKTQNGVVLSSPAGLLVIMLVFLCMLWFVFREFKRRNNVKKRF